ncbi:MAG: thiamine phosphate synthase [Rikenellaceae bacterium]
MKVIVITSPTEQSYEAEKISAILQAGVDRVHIRKPDWGVERVAKLIEGIAPELRDRLTLHDNFELCADLGVGGVQLNSRNGEIPSGFDGVVSRSCHSIEEIGGCTSEDYMTLSPIYDSISKCGYVANFTDEELRNANLGKRVIAMGGVTPHHIPMLHALGFGGVALLGYIWQSDDSKDEDSIGSVVVRASKAVKMARMCENFALQYITHRNDRTNDIEGARATLKGGSRWVQLRMKGFSDEEFLHNAHLLKEMCADSGATFLLNDRVELVKECGADGVHIGKGDMTPIDARKLLGDGAIIGGTANTTDDIDRLANQGVDYIGLGPFRFTTTKEKLSPTLGLKGYRDAMEYCHTKGYSVPIVAIGGITVDDIAAIMECGVSGIALSGTILNAEDSVAVTSDIIDILERY